MSSSSAWKKWAVGSACLGIVWVLIALPGCGAEKNDNSTGAPTAASSSPGVEQKASVGVVRLSEAQQRLAGIVTETLMPRVLARPAQGPGEIVLNAYHTAQVTPRIQAQVVSRQAKMGDHVEPGQALVTLSSVDMAGAQGKLVLAEREWQRVQALGSKVVSGRRFVEAQVSAQQARATVRAYGMTQAQIDTLFKSDKDDLADGRFTLLSPQQGTVIQDDFVLGEMIVPGRVLFEITDQSTLWVKARLAPDGARTVSIGDAARIRASDHCFNGHVTQLFQAIDEVTRTMPIRIEVPNPDGRLRPGLFVDVEITHPGGEPVLALREPAVLPTPDGDWEVFVEASRGEYHPMPVTLIDTFGGLAIVQGLKPGTTVVVEGAFYLQSELGKSGFDND